MNCSIGVILRTVGANISSLCGTVISTVSANNIYRSLRLGQSGVIVWLLVRGLAVGITKVW